jgi:hypothetical protein
VQKFIIKFSDPQLGDIYVWAKNQHYARAWVDRVWPHQKVMIVALILETEENPTE